MKCSICEKTIYGRSITLTRGRRVNGATIVEDVPMVCGSCPMNKAQGASSGKSMFQVRMDMAKLVTKPTPENLEGQMSHFVVRSNVRNRTILLDGRFPIVFGPDGLGKCPVHLRELFEREMMMRPGRYSEVAAAPPEPTPEVSAPLLEAEVPAVLEVAEVPEEVEEIEKDVPVNIDISFLSDEREPVKPAKKASKKK